ncbi:DUF4407 domain-containing protein [Aquirufa sp. 2-AUSEE-184A6]|jgi:Domain of unknown function (DUF4407)|uniref:DUF4407 domain-containing protein n=1 Tax=Aquirufa novilacunae TaxID=3139305 RepID=A0ABW8SZX1_9BACT
MKNNLWIKFGCFLTGYNYELLKECGEASKKSVKKFTAALVIISLIWAANGYNFSSRYLDSNIVGSLIGSVLSVIMIIMIERQIILSVRPKIWLKIFRFVLAFLMAMIGSVIIDQILFSKDLDELRKENIAQNYSDSLNLAGNKYNLQLEIQSNREQSKAADNDLQQVNRQIVMSGGSRSSTRSTTDSTNKTFSNTSTLDISPLINRAKNISDEKKRFSDNIDNLMLKQKQIHENYNKNKKPSSDGFLGELKLLFDFIFQGDSIIAPLVYVFWFLLFLTLELLVIIAKVSEDKNDYEMRVEFELDNNQKKIEFLSKKVTSDFNS